MREPEPKTSERDKPAPRSDSGVAQAAVDPDRHDARAESGFRATIENAGLWDLVQLNCGSRARCVACVRSGMRSGYLYFEDGQIVHATVGAAIGERAALDILSWPSGTFQSCDVPWPSRTSIDTPWQGLLLRAAQLQDEARRDGLLHAEVRVDAPGASYRPADFEHAVRVDAQGRMIAGHGRPEQLAALAAYVCRVGDLIGALLGMDALRALEGSLAAGASCLIFRNRGGDTIAVRPRDGVDLELLKAQLKL
jgi:hypothetical protein